MQTTYARTPPPAPRAVAPPEAPYTPPLYSRILSAHRGPHKTLDGYVAALPYSDCDWQALYEAVGRADELDTPVFRDPRLRLEQRAPFALFKAWAWLHVDDGGLIWPAPQGSRTLPRIAGDERGADLALAGLDEWAGLRPFRDGDSPRQVAWKAYARGAPLLVREYHDPRGSERVLDFAQLRPLEVEARLSQLAAWVLEADRDGDRWALRLPAESLPAGTGAAHRRACLDALARHGFTGAIPSP